MIRHKHLSLFCLLVHHAIAISITGHFPLHDPGGKVTGSLLKLLNLHFAPIALNALLKRSKLSDHNKKAQQCSQRILFFFAWKIKPLFHICIFPKSVCCKNLKINTNAACCFILRTLIVSNHC